MSGNLNQNQYKVAIVSPTPFYYHIPLYRQLAKASEIDLMVYYCSDEALEGREVKEMYQSQGKIVKKDNLLGGYNCKFLKNYSPCPSYMKWPWGLINLGIWGEIKEGGYDVVIIKSWANFTWWLALVAGLIFETPVFFFTDTNVFSDLERSKFKIILKKIFLQKFLFKKASGFLVSGKANQKFYQAYGAPESKMVKLPYWWGYEKFLAQARKLKPKRKEFRESFDLSEEDFVLLYVGRFAKEKDLFTLLQAYHKVDSENKRLFLVGDGSLRPKIEKYIERFKLKGVRLMGFQPQEKLLNFYTLADALVLPSREEPWGMVVNEAMCFGLPIIASDRVGAGMELVKQGENGFIFPVGESDQLRSDIEKLINFSDQESLAFNRRSVEIIRKWIQRMDPVQQMIKALNTVAKKSKIENE